MCVYTCVYVYNWYISKPWEKSTAHSASLPSFMISGLQFAPVNCAIG